MTILPQTGSNTTGSMLGEVPAAESPGRRPGNMSSGFRHGPSRSIMLVMVTSPMLSVRICCSLPGLAG